MKWKIQDTTKEEIQNTCITKYSKYKSHNMQNTEFTTMIPLSQFIILQSFNINILNPN